MFLNFKREREREKKADQLEGDVLRKESSWSLYLC